MASFETSLYDENLKPRADFGLAELMGASKAGDVVGTNGNAYSARIESDGTSQPHALLDGFNNTAWLAGAQNRIPLRPIDKPLLTVVPGFVHYPPAGSPAYPTQPHTSEPAVVLRQSGSSRTVWFPGDIERTYWLTGHGDLLRLLHDAIRWVSHDDTAIITVEGAGFLGDALLGDWPWIRRSPAQLHQPRRSAWLAGGSRSARAADDKHAPSIRS